MTAPSVLYKYESINQFSLRNIKNAQLFFRRPADFNDPFDCVSWIDASSKSPDQLVDLFNIAIEEGKIPIHEKASSISDVPDEFLSQVDKGVLVALEYQKKHFGNGIGCTCFSSVNDNILMWSHYSDGHRGMCLEFDTGFSPFEHVFQVRYNRHYPEIDAVKMVLDDPNNAGPLSEGGLKPLLTKAEGWQYEKEWRAFHTEPDHAYTYSVQALKAVYFGVKASPTDIEIVCLILQGQSKEIKFYQAHQNADRYELSFEECDYTPFLALSDSDEG